MAGILSRLRGGEVKPHDQYVWLTLNSIPRPEHAPGSLATVLAEYLAEEPREAFYVAAVDDLGVRSVSCVARGEYHRVDVPLPLVMAIPILAGANRLVVAHNHPVGELLPSDEDWEMTRAIAKAANHFGMVLDDSVIVAPDGKTFSMREAGHLSVATVEPLTVRS